MTSCDNSAFTDSELRRQAAPVLSAAVVKGLQVAGLRLVTPDGAVRQSLAGPRDGRPSATMPKQLPPGGMGSVGTSWSGEVSLEAFQGAIDMAVSWDPALEKNGDFAHARLVVKKLAGKLTEADVTAFAQAYPSLHAEEIACWLGMKDLYAEKPKEATSHFAKVAEGDSEGEYAPLARLGVALAARYETEEEVILRVGAERKVLECLETREDWADDIKRRMPEGMAASLADTEWIDEISVLSPATELTKWLNGPHTSIPWLRVRDSELTEDVVSRLRKELYSGKIAFGNAAAFSRLNATVRPDKPESSLLEGEAGPVLEWGGKRYDFPFLKGVKAVRYDAKASQALIPVRLVAAAGPEVEPFLQAHKHWFACVARLFKVKDGPPDSRGAIVFLPDRILDSPDSRRFLQGLAEFSLEAVARSQGGAPSKPAVSPPSMRSPAGKAPRKPPSGRRPG